MLDRPHITLNRMVDTLKAAAESSRMRLLVLLSHGDLTVSDMTEILNQSQPRVSRHLKLLMEAGLIDRYQEGSWAYYHLGESEAARDLAENLLKRIDPSDGQVERDLERLGQVKTRLREKAAEYFARNAGDWNELRTLHAPDAAVEQALKSAIGAAPFQAMLDIGTGTGRMLELFAGQYRRALGVDASREMLAVARANLDDAGLTQAQVRLGDVTALPVERDQYDLATIHQVLHYLDNPAVAVAEAARALRPNGRLAIVDFAPHGLEFLREEHHHIRLGFSDAQIREWLEDAGLVLEETRAIEERGTGGEQLTVKLWIGRDPRMLIAGNGANLSTTETA
ncbi:MAG: metalloregulator ArsR/SmtB family transcription factor [Notoacmeibacter sp.]|nr:metalloregulator ArsR/SmtB family transcription factor [Notoacmeibacter sp.]